MLRNVKIMVNNMLIYINQSHKRVYLNIILKGKISRFVIISDDMSIEEELAKKKRFKIQK